MSVRRPVLLLIDEEESVRGLVERVASEAGFEVSACADHETGLRLVGASHTDLALAGLRHGGTDGIDLLQAIHRVDASCQVVLMRPEAAVGSAVAAIGLGARDCLAKPLDPRRLEALLSGIRDELWQRQHLLASEGDVAERLALLGMVGRAPVMQELFSTIRRMAPHVRVALVIGETGTGKELVARALHALGPWRDHKFSAVSCAGLSASVSDGESAGEVGLGLLEAVWQGTLLLDDVAELPARGQGALLRLLEAGDGPCAARADGRRLGVQLIAATGRDLRDGVAAGRFRRDLQGRLGEVTLRVPPLRDRREDIPYLAAHFVREFSREFQKPIRGITLGAEGRLVSASWPGNVRELRNVLERACLLADGDLLSERDVADGLVGPAPGPAAGFVPPTAGGGADGLGPLVAPLSAMERDCVLRALHQAGGNKKLAATLLGLSRRAFYRRLERHQLDDVIHRRAGRSSVVCGPALA